MDELTLRPHPRLFVSPDTADHLEEKLHSPFLESQAERVIEDADLLVEAEPIAEGEAPSYLAGTRALASHLECLTAAWVLTRQQNYRKAALRHMAGLMNWHHISCEARHNTPHELEMPFCLSYGEHAADLALMYDLFRPDMTVNEQRGFFDVLDRFYMKEALKCLTNPPWWAYKEWSNWNGVCSGGMGMMALAFYDDLPDARKLIPFVEESLGEYFTSYIRNGGGCHEGTGYWNYGMHNAVGYLLSWEAATGREHPAFTIEEVGRSLHFPLDFTGITFGDNDGWSPMGFFFMLARRTRHHDAALAAATRLPERAGPRDESRGRLARAATGDLLFAADEIPPVEEITALTTSHAEEKEPLARVYEGLGWAVLADDSVFPALRMAARGGSSTITGHGHVDLLSFKCMVNGERFITDQGGHSPASFTSRGHDLFHRSVASKSTLFVDGLGCDLNTTCDRTEVVADGDIRGVRIDGSSIYLSHWREVFAGRLFLMVESAYWLIIDRVTTPNTADLHWMEARFYSSAESSHGADWVTLESGDERLTMTFAALGDAVMQQSLGLPDTPAKQATMFRWMSARGYHDNLQVTALNPAAEKLALAVDREEGGDFAIEVTRPDGDSRTIRLTSTLELIRGD